MLINQIELENFFCYVGGERFHFEPGLNIVSAKNAGGKSHLFNAFQWVFFNTVYVDKSSDTSKKEWKSADKVITLPDHIIFYSKDGDILKTRVKVSLIAEYHENYDAVNDLVEYNFEKEVRFRKNGDDILFISKPELQISYVRDGETKYLSEGEHKWFLGEVFPEGIRKFMWFQGETVDELYDFSNPSTLNSAINKISYYPIYETLAKITSKSETSIGNKVQKVLKEQKKFTKEQEDIYTQFEYTKRKIEDLEVKIDDARNDILKLSDAILDEEEKLKGYDKYTHWKTTSNEIDYKIKDINQELDNLIDRGKSDFIGRWMLNRCEHLIDASSENLNLLHEEIKTYQNNANPVPLTLPGPEYVQRMLNDHVCYICERRVEEDTPAYHALVTRMEDFRWNEVQKNLSDNYTDLVRFKSDLARKIPRITEELVKYNEDTQLLIDKRRKLHKKKEDLKIESGISENVILEKHAETATQILNKIKNLNSSKSQNQSRITKYEIDLMNYRKSLNELNNKKLEYTSLSGESIQLPEKLAADYIDVLKLAVDKLKDSALNTLIREITVESNVLYSKYLGGNTQGRIEIEKGVRIVDKATGKQLTNLNTAELTAQKLAVTNSFLSLSEKKLNRSFPLLADAPTSEFDYENTLFLTRNLSSSFKQIIIMSKDYDRLSDHERIQFLKEANISTFYELINDLIDNSKGDSRNNKKTFVKKIK